MTPKNYKLPANVDIHNGYYQYRHRVPKADRASSPLKFDRWGRCPRVKLCSIDASYEEMLVALGKVIQSYQMQIDEDYLSLGWLHQQWLQHTPTGKHSGSRAYKGLATSTQKRYDTSAVILEHKIKINGLPSQLRQVRADQFDTITLRQILDKRYMNGSTPANLNNELALFGNMYKFGRQYLKELKHVDSPTKGIEKFAVKKRTRYVTDNDYKIQYKVAGAIGQFHIQDYMELTYLLAARSIETSELKIGQATEQGIIVIRKKGSLNTGIRWSPRLREAWDRALARHKTTHPDPAHNIITDKHGRQITQSTIHDHWGLVRVEMKKRGLSDIYFTAQNLKVKGIKDAEDTAIAGQSEVMQRYYQDTEKEVAWFNSPNKK